MCLFEVQTCPIVIPMTHHFQPPFQAQSAHRTVPRYHTAAPAWKPESGTPHRRGVDHIAPTVQKQHPWRGWDGERRCLIHDIYIVC